MKYMNNRHTDAKALRQQATDSDAGVAQYAFAAGQGGV